MRVTRSGSPSASGRSVDWRNGIQKRRMYSPIGASPVILVSCSFSPIDNIGASPSSSVLATVDLPVTGGQHANRTETSMRAIYTTLPWRPSRIGIIPVRCIDAFQHSSIDPHHALLERRWRCGIWSIYFAADWQMARHWPATSLADTQGSRLSSRRPITERNDAHRIPDQTIHGRQFLDS